MKPFKKILYPVDLSDTASGISPLVIMMAEKFDAEIYLLFVVRTFNHYNTVYDASVAVNDFVLWNMEDASAKIENYAETYFKDYPHSNTKVIIGDPVHKILDYVKSEEIDLVIMGTHGRKGLNRFIFGSVANSVVKMSSAPVLTINTYSAMAEMPPSKA